MNIHGEETDGRPDDHGHNFGRQIPSLDEALQYSPFTSILPFSTEVISPPEALPASDSPNVLSNYERNLASHALNSLDSEAVNASTTFPRLVDHVLDDLQHSLNPQELTQYNFTIPPNVQHAPRQPNAVTFLTNGQSQTDTKTTQLGPFAKMALNMTNVNWRYSNPTAPRVVKNPKSHTIGGSGQGTQDSNGLESFPIQPCNPNHIDIPTSSQSVPHVIPPTSEVDHPPIVIIPAPGAYGNSVREVPQQSLSAVAPNVPSSSTFIQSNVNLSPNGLQPMVIIPDFPPSSDPSQYQSRPDLDAALSNGDNQIPRKRKREDQDTGAKVFTDNREVGTAAVQSFQEMLIDIFEAEDHLDPETFEMSSDSHRYFIPGRDSNGPCLAIGPAVLNTLEKSMTKLINLKRFSDLQVEQLARLQRLSLASLASAAEIDLQIPSDDDDDTVDQWVRRVEVAENSLRASRLLLKMMIAGKTEKQLSSEELVRELVNNLKHILETAIIPLVEKRKSSQESEFFEKNTEHRALMVSLLLRAGRILALSGDLVVLGELSETSVTTVEFLATKIVFTENAPSDKESILGMQKFEALRRHAMDVVAKVFLRHSEQRDFLLSEILSSLEKLPVTRQSARQYKISEGKPIQLVSALIMQLVQTSTIRDLSSGGPKKSDELAEDLAESDAEASSPDSTSEPKPRRPAANGVHSASSTGPIALLDEVSTAGSKIAETNASSVCHYLVQRALNTTKTGDQPYRNLLDIFTEDFLNVLGFPEWPAAEILLRALLVHFLRIAGDEKSSAPAKNMALDLMGTIGSGIADLRAYVKRAADTAEADSGNVIKDFSQMCEDSLVGTSLTTTLLQKESIYRVIVEYLQIGDTGSLQLQSARCFYITQWARNVCEAAAKEGAAEGASPESPDTTKSTTPTLVDVAQWLTSVMQGRDQRIDEREFRDIRPTEARLYHALVLLNMPLCRAFDRVFNVLLRALSSQQATVRSRGVKSVSQLVEKDATILDRAQHVMAYIVHATTDASPLVRDSALTLIGKCMAIKPALETDASNALIGMSCDPATGVRKRALKLLRDLYLRNKRNDLRAAIADAILRRLDDVEETIVDLARQSLEDIWLTPFYGHSLQTGSLSAQARHDLEGLAALIVTTVSRGDGVATVLETLFKQVLGEASKNGHANQEVCRAVVALLFESIIDNEQGDGKPSRKMSLQTLTVFAKSDPGLFDAEQMITLRPYIDNISFSSDDILVYRSIVMIYRRVLPVLPPLQKGFLLGVQDVLLNNITKLGKQELNEATACLWIINDVLQNTERLARVMISVLAKIESSKKGSMSESKEIQTMKRLIMLAGYFGKACDFQSQLDLFQEKSPSWNGTSVSELIVDILVPLAARSSPANIRESALDSICLVCQAWPRNFLKPEVTATFRSAFEDREPRLVSAVLSGIRSFYLLEDERAKTVSEESPEQPGINGANKLGKSMTFSHNDGASTTIAQQFLQDVLRIALSSRGDLAMLATDIITSTNRQGLVHPKECGPALVSLETSPDPFVAKAALEEHRSLHAKHESMMDKEYVKAVEQAFMYQRDTIGSLSGVDSGLNAKLRSFYEVLKSGSVALRKKLLGNLCARINADGTKYSEKDLESRLQFARFVVENLSLFEYSRVDELLHLISCIEKIFTSSGNTLSQRIELLLSLQAQVQDRPQQILNDQPADPQMAHVSLDRQELYNVTTTSMTLSMLWQTRSYLRRAWGLQSLRSGKAKPPIKDMNKAPVRVANISVEEHIEHISHIMSSLETEEKMIRQCRTFVDLLTIDNELKIGSDEEGDSTTRYGTPSEDGTPAAGENGSMGPPSASSKRSRKMTPSSAATTPKGTPIKRERQPSGTPRRSSKMSIGEDDELGWD